MEINESNITLDDLELIDSETIELNDVDIPMLRGLSAYAVAVKNGYTGTEEQWLASLKGDKGDTGEQGIQGERGIQGIQGVQGETGATGNGIDSITLKSGTHASGQLDTYEIEYTNGNTTEFQVYNGQDGSGDMEKTTYDTNNNGIVDNAEKVNNHTVEEDVPANAVFTDTVYDDTALSGRVNTLENAGYITKAVNDLINYYTKSETYTQTEINQMVSAIPKFAIEVVQTLPVQDISTTTIYLLVTGAETQNLYTEYIYVNNSWEKLGTQTVDLTGYYTKTETDNLLNTKANQTDLQALNSNALKFIFIKKWEDGN